MTLSLLFSDPEADERQQSPPRLVRMLGARFTRDAHGRPSAAELELINSRHALAKMEAGDVYVRRAWIANNLVDAFSTRFTDQALGQIAELIAGRPVMRNHDRFTAEAMPVARYFAGALEEREGVLWAVGSFFWPSGGTGDYMARLIDAGVWKDSSLAWYMDRFVTSVDGRPVGESPYYPGQVLDDGKTVIGIMDEVTEVEEGSLVAIGAQKGTFLQRSTGRGVVTVERAIEQARFSFFATRAAHGEQAPPQSHELTDGVSAVVCRPREDRGWTRFFQGGEGCPSG